MTKRKILKIAFFPIIFLLIPIIGFAINTVTSGYKTTGQPVEIEAHNLCKQVNHTSGNAVFVPTKTANEWNRFISNKPNNVAISECTNCNFSSIFGLKKGQLIDEGGVCMKNSNGEIKCFGGNGHGVLEIPTGINATALAFDGNRTGCSLNTNKSITCWGDVDFFNKPKPTGSVYTSISGGLHYCALKTNGGIDCWGYAANGQASPPSSLDFKQVSAGRADSCGLKNNGSVVCWGKNDYNRGNPPSGVTFSQIDLGGESCGVTTAGNIRCWGHNGQGMMNVPSGNNFSKVSIAQNNGCGLRTNGTVACWGANDFGQLNNIPGDSDFIDLFTTGYNSCGLKPNGKLKCWGYENSVVYSATNSDAVISKLGESGSSCFLQDDGNAICFGSDQYGQVSGHQNNLNTYVQVTSMNENACGLKANGGIYCWGRNSNGEGNPPSTNNFTQITSGYDFSCALRSDGRILCWGANYAGQATPPTTNDFKNIEAGFNQACGIKNNNTVQCWGNNDNGQATPPSGIAFTEIASGDRITCGLKSNGVAQCWGSVYGGDLNPPSGQTFTKIAAGGGYACGIKTNGTIYCWGNTSVTIPYSDANIVQLEAAKANFQICIMNSDNQVKCRAVDRTKSIYGIDTGVKFELFGCY